MAPTPTQEAPKPPRGALWRQDVDQAVDAGLGYFLQRLDVAPSFDSEGRFEGFRIVALNGEEYWADVDLKPGDVVLRVNGKPIERENQAYEVFQSLKTAQAIEVQFLRGDQRRTISYRIIAQQANPQGNVPAPAQPSPAPAQPGPAASAPAAASTAPAQAQPTK